MEPIPNAMIAAANAKSRKLRELVRAPEILVMPGAYDVLSALLFEQMGFKAIQGTSGGIAVGVGLSRRRGDEPGNVYRNQWQFRRRGDGALQRRRRKGLRR